MQTHRYTLGRRYRLAGCFPAEPASFSLGEPHYTPIGDRRQAANHRQGSSRQVAAGLGRSFYATHHTTSTTMIQEYRSLTFSVTGRRDPFGARQAGRLFRAYLPRTGGAIVGLFRKVTLSVCSARAGRCVFFPTRPPRAGGHRSNKEFLP